MGKTETKMRKDMGTEARYGMAIDLDRCDGCGACMVACAVENNVSVCPKEAGTRKGITWIRLYRAGNGVPYPGARAVTIPILCQHCGGHTPCVSVCPQNAVDVDSKTGIVSQIPVRCFGCRYCMAACPYHARYFNWWDPVWPEGMEKALNPAVATRTRGVVEKCNLCHGRLQAAMARAAAAGERPSAPAYTPACVEACPRGAMTFGNLDDPESDVAKLAKSGRAFQLLPRLGLMPKIHYLTSEAWVRDLGESLSAVNATQAKGTTQSKEAQHG